jgi:chemotaxis signal transduction protein
VSVADARNHDRDHDTPAAAQRAVLEARAAALARPVAARDVEDVLPLVTFTLADETYGVDARIVFEARPLADVALLPGAQPPDWGLTVWRGQLLRVLDLRSVLGVARGDLHDLSHLLVLGADRRRVGIVVDAVGEVRSLAPDEIGDLPEGFTAGREFLRGITKDATLLLDTERLPRL